MSVSDDEMYPETQKDNWKFIAHRKGKYTLPIVLHVAASLIVIFFSVCTSDFNKYSDFLHAKIGLFGSPLVPLVCGDEFLTATL